MTHIKKALITGCGRGIGAAVAQELARRSVELVALNRSRESLNRVVESIQDVVTVSPYCVDVTDFDTLEVVLGQIVEQHPDIDLVILNAGIDIPQRIESFDWRIAKQQIDTNLTANYVFAAKLIPQLLKRESARFAVVSSLGAFAGFPLEHAYNASKAGARMMVEGLRAELLDGPVGVTGIYPGFVATDMIKGNAFDSSSAIGVEDAALRIVDGLFAGEDDIIFPEELKAVAAQIGSLSPRERATLARQMMGDSL